MGVIIKRKGARATTWRVRIRRGGHELSRNFLSAEQARDWEREVERAIDKATPRAPFRPTDWQTRPVHADFLAEQSDPRSPPLPRATLAAAIGKYIRATEPTKEKENRLMAWTRNPVLAQQPFEAVSAEDLQAWIDKRGRDGIAANTIRNDVFALSGVYSHANEVRRPGGRGGWGMSVINPCGLIELPPPGDSRERRLYQGEEERIRKALSEVPDAEQMTALFSILLETGMRLGEAMAILPGWYVRAGSGTHYLAIPGKNTKTKKKRNVVLSQAAAEALAAITAARSQDEAHEPYFTLNRPAVEYRWKIAREAARAEDLHLHDLRHEALSRMSEMGFTLEELKNQSGHSSVKVLMRYLQANLDRMARKMAVA